MRRPGKVRQLKTDVLTTEPHRQPLSLYKLTTYLLINLLLTTIKQISPTRAARELYSKHTSTQTSVITDVQTKAASFVLYNFSLFGFKELRVFC